MIAVKRDDRDQDWKNVISIATFVGEYCSWRRTILLNQFQRRGVKI